MKAKYLPLVVLLCCLLPLKLQGQMTEAYRNILFTEYRSDNPTKGYYELTNMGDQTVNLSNYGILNVLVKLGPDQILTDPDGNITDMKFPAGSERNYARMPDFELAPDQSFIISTVYDGVSGFNSGPYYWEPVHNLNMFALTDWAIHQSEGASMEQLQALYMPEVEVYDFDSITIPGFYLIRNNLGDGDASPILIQQIYDEFGDLQDSVVIDVVGLDLDENNDHIDKPSDVAGVFEATKDHILVRKANIMQGNTDWDISRGVDAEDSEWMLLPMFSGDMLFTSVKTHGNFSLSVGSDVFGVDTDNSQITIPWGVYKGDSAIAGLTLGDGMGWLYTEDTNDWADSAHLVCQLGDIITLYACGNTLAVQDFEVVLGDAPDDLARVYPKRRAYIPEEDDPRYDPNLTQPLWGNAPFYVTEGIPVIDTVGGIPFSMRVDSLYKYLDKAENATWEISWVDETERVDLILGDKLKVTAADGTTTKEYFLDVAPYDSSTNAYLSAITWPDKDIFLEGWNGDTIAGFQPARKNYSILLPYGTTDVPALKAIPEDLNAKINISPALTLKGGFETRTTTIQVTAEIDTVVYLYKITFEVEKAPEDVQAYFAEPFISEFSGSQFSWNSFLEIVNPGTEPLDLSQYLILKSISTTSPSDALMDAFTAHQSSYDNRYRLAYVPGYKFSDDTTNWELNPGILESDVLVDPIVDPRDVFVMAKLHFKGDDRMSPDWEQADVIMGPHRNTWGLTPERDKQDLVQFPGVVQGMWIMKIENDSVLNGKKPFNDFKDYKVVSAWTVPAADGYPIMAGIELPGELLNVDVIRKPYATKPDTIPGQGFGTNADDSDWWVRRLNEFSPYDNQIFTNQDLLSDNVGNHVMDPITFYFSTVSSLYLKISEGYVSPQSIGGVPENTSVSAFYELLIKADPDQTFSLIGSDGLPKTDEQILATDDTLVVVSADNQNMTKYALAMGALDDNATLVPVEGSGVTISVDGGNGKVSGFTYGITVVDLLDKLIKPESASLSVLNPEGEPVPLHVMNFNIVKVATKAYAGMVFRVTAEDFITVIDYVLEPEGSSSDAFVLSDVYEVVNENLTISLIPYGTSVTSFMSNIVVVGKSAQILDKNMGMRETGNIAMDDRLKVVSEDGTVTMTYYLNFFDEVDADINLAPEILLAFKDTVVEIGSTVSLTATVNDDGVPTDQLTYSWSVVSGDAGAVTISSPDQLTTDVSISAAGIYMLQLEASDSELTSRDTVRISDSPTGIKPYGVPDLLIYPNPASERFTVQLEGWDKQRTVLTVSDVTGKAVYSTQLSDPKTGFDVSEFENGLYFITIQSGKYQLVRKLSISK